MQPVSEHSQLSVDILLANARQATGLNDFGDDWFLEPLTRLIGETNSNAGLIAPDAGAGQRVQGALMAVHSIEKHGKAPFIVFATLKSPHLRAVVSNMDKCRLCSWSEKFLEDNPKLDSPQSISILVAISNM